MAYGPGDWLNWQDRLKQLAEGNPEATWPDPNAQQLEDVIISQASRRSMTWMLNIWLLITGALKSGDEKDFDDVIDATEDDPIDIEETVEHVVESLKLAKKRVQYSLKLPNKGPWIEVPERPEHIKAPFHKLPKQAEWIARQSAGAKMREWAEGMREDVRWQVAQAIRADMTADDLAKVLEGRWDSYAVNFQRIAVTELSMAYNNAILAHLGNGYVIVPPIGDEKVCKECAHWVEGKVFWVSPTPINDPTKQEYQQYVWEGKSNVGRKKPDWWPCIPMHPNCRHVFVRYRGGDPYSYAVKKGARS